MANTYVDYTATADQTDFAFSFSYLEDAHVKVEINGVNTSAFTISTSPSNKVVLNSGATAGDIVRVRRSSQPDTDLVDFVNGSVLTESELDRAYLHNRYLNEEIAELNEASLQVGPGGTDWDGKSNKILNVSSPTLSADAATKNYVDQKVEQIATGASNPPTKWQFTGSTGANTTYAVTGADVVGDSAYDVSINGLVKEPTVDYTVDPDTDTLTIIPTLTGGEDIVIIQRGLGIPLTQGTVGTSQIVDDAVTYAKIQKVASNNVLLGNDNGSSQDVQELSASDARTLLNVADGANNYTHPNHTGDVTSTADGATVIASGAVTSSKISTSDVNFNVSGGGNTGLGIAASGSHKLSVNGDVLVQDTNGDNSPAVIMQGTAGAVLQLNDQSTNGQIFNISSNPDSSARGGFGIGYIATAGTPITTVTHVSSTSTATTFQTATTHGLKEGQYVVLSGSTGDWNGVTEVIGVPSTTQFVVPKFTTSTDYPTTVTPNDTNSTFIIRRHEESNVLYNMIKLIGLPQGTSEPSWAEAGQLWIDTTDNTIKIKPETHS
jgi:hypothetical protein|tara:strand:- start:338 stop:1984 length:1647 start_codon:yes stop_codon:yes gene_type:complete